jgi:flagellar basal body-associated protein FliL
MTIADFLRHCLFLWFLLVPVVGMFIGAVMAYFRSMMSQQASPDQQG